MTEETYQEYISRQEVLFDDGRAKLQAAYDQLLIDHKNERTKKDNEILYLGKKAEQLQKDIEQLNKDNLDLIKLSQTQKNLLKQIIGRIPWSQVRNMFRFEEDPTYVYFSINGDGELHWLKSPYEFQKYQESLKSEL